MVSQVLNEFHNSIARRKWGERKGNERNKMTSSGGPSSEEHVFWRKKNVVLFCLPVSWLNINDTGLPTSF